MVFKSYIFVSLLGIAFSGKGQNIPTPINITKPVAVVSGKIYIGTLDITNPTNQILFLRIFDENNNLVSQETVASGANGSTSFSFTASNTAQYQIWIGFDQGFNNASFSIDNYSLSHLETTVEQICSTEDSYRYGFNGMEKDDEVKGAGNSYNFGARLYDPRLGRWLSIDPYFDSYKSENPYNFSSNSPIIMSDFDGNKVTVVIQKGFLGIGRKKVVAEIDQATCQIKFNGIKNPEKLSAKAKGRMETARIALQNDLDNYDTEDGKLTRIIEDKTKNVKLVFGKVHSANPDKIVINPISGAYYGIDIGVNDGTPEIKGSNSPAEIMSGEFRHVYNMWYDPDYKKRAITFDKDWDDKEEKYNYEEFELKVLGAERNGHGAIMQQVENVLDKPVMLPKDSGWEIDGKGNYYKDNKKYSSQEVKEALKQKKE